MFDGLGLAETWLPEGKTAAPTVGASFREAICNRASIGLAAVIRYSLIA